jgi:hypothetical protein
MFLNRCYRLGGSLNAFDDEEIGGFDLGNIGDPALAKFHTFHFAESATLKKRDQLKLVELPFVYVAHGTQPQFVGADIAEE